MLWYLCYKYTAVAYGQVMLKTTTTGEHLSMKLKSQNIQMELF